MIVPAALLAAHSDELISPVDPDDPAWGDEPPDDELLHDAAMMATATNAKPLAALHPKPNLRFTRTSSRSQCAPRIVVRHFIGVAELCQASRRRWTRTTRTNNAIPMTARTTTDA